MYLTFFQKKEHQGFWKGRRTIHGLAPQNNCRYFFKGNPMNLFASLHWQSPRTRSLFEAMDIRAQRTSHARWTSRAQWTFVLNGHSCSMDIRAQWTFVLNGNHMLIEPLCLLDIQCLINKEKMTVRLV